MGTTTGPTTDPTVVAAAVRIVLAVAIAPTSDLRAIFVIGVFVRPRSRRAWSSCSSRFLALLWSS